MLGEGEMSFSSDNFGHPIFISKARGGETSLYGLFITYLCEMLSQSDTMKESKMNVSVRK